MGIFQSFLLFCCIYYKDLSLQDITTDRIKTPLLLLWNIIDPSLYHPVIALVLNLTVSFR